MIRRPPRSTPLYSSAASDVYKRQGLICAGLALGAKIYIMTSALRIGQDVLLPALEEGKPSKILAFVCPYSLHPFALACLICGLRGVILTFARGACADYGSWLLADKGIKPEQTSIGLEGKGFLAKLFPEVQEANALNGKRGVSNPPCSQRDVPTIPARP